MNGTHIFLSARKGRREQGKQKAFPFSVYPKFGKKEFLRFFEEMVKDITWFGKISTFLHPVLNR